MAESTRTLEMLELVGGALCLDFANTINSRLHPEHDYLLNYSDLVGWADKVGILSPAQASQLQKRAKQNPDEAENALKNALSLRELLYRLLSSSAKDSEPKKEDLALFTKYHEDTISRGQLLKTEKHYITVWKLDAALDALLLPIIHSASELLLSNELGQVKQCPGCGWLFLDTSKNQSRRWCSMNTCVINGDVTNRIYSLFPAKLLRECLKQKSIMSLRGR
jgi:predicted RNA-binding Zn ribbon-like protein